MIHMKMCKHCHEEMMAGAQFMRSSNSDDGYFPLCIGCVDNLRAAQISNWNRYYAKAEPFHSPERTSN